MEPPKKVINKNEIRGKDGKPAKQELLGRVRIDRRLIPEIAAAEFNRIYDQKRTKGHSIKLKLNPLAELLAMTFNTKVIK